MWESPACIDPIYSTATPDETIELYSGTIRVINARGAFEGTGKAYVDWRPSPRIRLDGELSGVRWNELQPGLAKVEVCHLESVATIDAQITSTTKSLRDSVTFTAELSGGMGQGDSLASLTFHVSNLPEFHGSPIHSGSSEWTGRTELACHDWSIVLDRVFQANLFSELKRSGGWAITHVGSIRRPAGSAFTVDEVEGELESLRWFLSFCTGRWTGPGMAVGHGEGGEAVWWEWSLPRANRYQYVRSWVPPFWAALSELYPQFHKKWHDLAWRETIRNCVYWYLTANAAGASIENATVLSFVAFETLAFSRFVDRGKMSNSKFKDMSFAERLRRLLNESSIECTVPTHLTKLEAAVSANNDLTDGPDAIAKIRNAHVHPSRTKRQFLSHIGMDAEREGALLAMQYLELILLCSFGYNGRYVNRTKRGFVGDATENVPCRSTL